jgi:predicted extracellular nuclease
MLVSVTEPAIAIAPTSASGEYVLVRPEHRIDRVFPGEDTGLLIKVDDGALIRHSDASALPYVVHTGDRVSSLAGPLAASFDNYIMEPLEPPTIEAQVRGEVRQLPQPGPNEFSIATFDIESISGSTDPGQSNDRRDQDQDKRRRDQIVSTIEALGTPTVIGLQEVESLDVLESIAIHPNLVPHDYQAILSEESISPDGNVGFLIRGDRITVTGVEQYQTPEGLFGHPPLMITMRVHMGSTDDVTVYAIVNHFASPDGGGPLAQALRIKEAKWNASLVDQILTANPEAFLVLLGNLNAHYDSAPLRTLTEGESPARRLLNTTQALPPGDRYSVVSHGVSQLLDHILVTPELAVRQVRVDVLHVNADHPPADPDQTNLYHSSSHDPIVVFFDLGN